MAVSPVYRIVANVDQSSVLSDTDKAQARTNIGAAAAADLQTEISNRSTADTTINNRISTLATNLSTETENRTAADTALQNAIAAKTVNVTSPITKTAGGDGNPIVGMEASPANGTYGDLSGTRSLAWGDSFKTIKETVDNFGRIVDADTVTLTLPALSANDFRGSMNNALIPNGTFQQATVTRVSGNISISSNAITLPKGTYHITLKDTAVPHVTEDGSVYVDDTSIVSAIYLDGTIYDQFDFHPAVTSSISQDFTYALDLVLSGTHSVSFYAKYVSTGTQQWDCGGQIWIHSVANATTGGTGGGLSAVVHDATLTGDGTAASPLSVVGGGGDSRGIPPTMDSEGYYHIYTLAQMLWVNNSLANLPEKNYKLMNDIVCNSDYSDYLSWETTPPMNEMLAENGGCIQANYFDGNGHTIYGMYSYNVSANDAAFFGNWASGTRPTIKNVRMKNCTVIGNTTAEAIIANGTYSNICVESCLFKNLYEQAWAGSTIIEQPSYYGASIVSNVYSINCTLKGANAYYHAGLFIGQVAGDGSSATSEFFNCYENQTESTMYCFAGSVSYPVNGKNLYKQSGASWNASGTFNLTDCAEKSTAEMKSQAFCDLLSSNASASSYPATWSYSDGMFPYLYNWTQE